MRFYEKTKENSKVFESNFTFSNIFSNHLGSTKKIVVVVAGPFFCVHFEIEHAKAKVGVYILKTVKDLLDTESDEELLYPSDRANVNH